MLRTANPAAGFVTLSIQQLTRWLACGTAFLVVMGVIVLYPKFVLGHDYVYGLVPKFDLNGEMNPPTWFSSSLLLLAALLLLYIAAMTRREGDRFARHWLVLASIFLLLSLDETGGLHGLLSRPLRDAFHLTGIFFHAWVVPFGIAVLILAAVNVSLVWGLPAAIRRLVVVAGVFYVGGALGGEAASGAFRTAAGELGDTPPQTLAYGLLAVAEETFEMLGIVTFNYALMKFIAERWGGVRIEFRRPRPV